MPVQTSYTGENVAPSFRVNIPRAFRNSLLRRLLRVVDMPLFLITISLLTIGLTMVYSSTLDWSYRLYGTVDAILRDQLRNVAIGVAVMLFLALLDYRLWRRWIIPALIMTIAMLVMVLFYGNNTLINARRSLISGSVQPGELAQLITVVYLATWLSANHGHIRSITLGLLPYLAIVGFITGLIFLQPDLTTVAIIIIVSGSMFFLAGATLRQFLVVMGIGFCFILVITLVGDASLDYAAERVDNFFRGLNSLEAADYHTRQARIAFRNGGMLGLGLGGSLQKFAGRLPAPHTDYIFAILVEELGVVGAMAVITLFVGFAYRGYLIALKANDALGSLLAVGITTMVITQAMMNIAVMASLLPSSGVPLPFISYGGSSLVTMLAGVGILLSVNRVTALQPALRGRSESIAYHDRRRGYRRAYLSRFGHGRNTTGTAANA